MKPMVTNINLYPQVIYQPYTVARHKNSQIQQINEINSRYNFFAYKNNFSKILDIF